MDNKYDVIIKTHPKDYYKLDLVVESLQYLNPQPEQIYILSPDGFYPKNTSYDSKITYIRDEEVIPYIDKTRLNHRPNWNWVNLVTIFQKFTENDLYLDVQSDNFFIKPINLFDANKRPRIFQNTFNPINNNGHWQYFNFSEKVFNIPKMNMGYSYIIEFLMYDKTKLKKLFDNYSNINDLLEKCYTNINRDSYPADQEIYGNLLEKYFPNDYEFVQDFPVLHVGHHITPSRETLVDFIEKNKFEGKFNACSYHTYL
jgi:hypothetical protein